MSLNLTYFRNRWEGKWQVENTVTHQTIEIGKGKTYTGTFELANAGTTFRFQGTDPRQKKWVDFHLMFSLVITKELVIKWEDGSAEVQTFSGDGKVLLKLDTDKSGVLEVIVVDDNFGGDGTAWESYYDKCPPV